MIIYLALFIYIVLINNICKPIIVQDALGEEKRVPSRIHVFLTMGMIVFIIGLRSTGGDTEQYVSTFKNYIPSGIESLKALPSYTGKGPLFRAIGIVCKTVTSDYHFYLFIVALLSGFLIARTLAKFSDYYAISIALFMIMATYTWMINGIRQFLAVSLIFSALNLLQRKKIVPYILIVVIAMSIHSSAFVMIFACFIVQGKAWNKKTILFMILGILAVIFVDRFINILDFLSIGTTYEGYTAQFAEDDGSNFIRTVIFAVPVILAFIRRQKIESIASPMINICINMSLMTVTISLIANVTSGILVGTVPIYFSIYNLILLPWLIYRVYPDKAKILVPALFAFYSVIFYLEGYPYYSDILFGGHYFNVF